METPTSVDPQKQTAGDVGTESSSPPAPPPVAAGGAPIAIEAPTLVPIDVTTGKKPKTSEKAKGKRTTLSLHQKAIVKTFCDQELDKCRARSEFVPSHETLRHEIATRFGWEVGRSTLSKIMSIEWEQLQLHGHPNPSMRRNRKPLFPAFEEDLVKSLRAYLVYPDNTSIAPDETAHQLPAATAGTGVGGVPILTEAIILEEAQRLKQQHGIKDEELVLSVGWLARFKHRNGIRLRKTNGTQGESLAAGARLTDITGLGMSSTGPELPLHLSNHMNKRLKMSRTDHAASLSRAQGFEFAANFGLLDASSVYHETSPLADMAATCSIKAVLDGSSQDGIECATLASLLEAVPVDVRQFSCAHCSLSLPLGIEGLDIIVVGFNCLRDAYVAAALVGEHGSVTCIEANTDAANFNKTLAASYTTQTLSFAACNLQVLSVLDGLTHQGLTNNKDMVIINCSFCNIAHKSKILQAAFQWLKEGGECRVSYAASPRRLSLIQCSPWAQSIAAIYSEDFRRLCQYVGFLDPRCSSVRKFEFRAVDGAAVGVTTPPLQPAELTLRACRLFKLRLIEDRPEDYGERATFVGCLAGANPDIYRLDSDFAFVRNVGVSIDCNTSQILRLSWLKRAFSVEGDRSTHRGRFTPSHAL